MKMFTKGILFMFAFSLCLACGQSENTAVVPGQKQEVAKGKKAGPKAKKKKAGAKANANQKYWTGLEAELNIGAEKIKMIRDINQENNNKISQLAKDLDQKYTAKVKAIRIAEKKEVERILGPELYKQKLAFDKKWRASKPSAAPPKEGGR